MNTCYLDERQVLAESRLTEDKFYYSCEGQKRIIQQQMIFI